MASNNPNPAAGDRGARQDSFGENPNVAATNSQIAPFRQGRRLIAEIRYTRDIQVPIVENDDDLEWGWQSIPVRPATDDDDFASWEIFDNSKDYKTGWRRWHEVEGSA
jgi:hypothetical protein